MTAVPVLVAIAGSVVAARSYRLPLRLVAAWAARRPGFVVATGVARAARDRLLAPAVAALVLTVTLAVFSGAVATSIRAAQEGEAWRRAGAEDRVDGTTGGALDPAIAAALPADAAVVTGHRADATAFDGARPVSADVLIAPFAPLEAVTAGSPSAFVAPVRQPTAADHVPAVVSRRGLDGAPAAVGDRFTVLLASRTVAVEVVATAAAMPASATPDGPWLVVPDDGFAAAAPDADLPNNVLAAAIAEDRVGAVAAAVSAVDPTVAVTTRVDLLGELRDTPLTRGVVVGFRAVAVASVVAALAASVTVLSTTAAGRGRDSALLAALGTGPRDVTATGSVALLPPVLGAVLAGAGLGVGLTHLVRGALDLSPFVGGATAVALAPSVPVTLAITAVTVVGATVLVVVSVLLARRTSPVHTLRTGAAP